MLQPSQRRDCCARVRVLPGGGPWFGVTYKQDREVVVRSIRELIDGGAYPEHLWT